VPLRYLFVDMNAYFASVEQQDDPRLRGKPVAVTAVDADTTCCLAASYEAKAFGIKTGMPVWEARRRCPGLVTRVGRHDRYTEVHHQIVKAVGRVLPVSAVLSIDELACDLIGAERSPARATELGKAVKAAIRTRVGDTLRCSVGVGPNVLLAKVAGDMQKPDGLTLIEDADLPTKLYPLKLTDFPGIGPRMEVRLHRYGVTAVPQLFRLTAAQLATVWGSKVHGERWFWRLRGEDVPDAGSKRRTCGHSHVLPPALRTDAGAYGVLSKLIHKAAARLRSLDHWAGALTVGMRCDDRGRWDAGCKVARCQDTLSLHRAMTALWDRRPPTAGRPRQVWLVLTDLLPTRSSTPSLFEADRRATDLSHAMDRVNRRFGKHKVRFGTVCGSEGAAPSRIAFTEIPAFNPAFGG
jgi:DNA polymerase-4